jgi:uncharacterized membrane protein
MSLCTGDDAYDDAARISLGIGLVGAAGEIVTGLRDYSFIPKERPSHEIATRHRIGNAIATSLFTASYLLRRKDADPGPLARLFGLAGGGLALYTAWLGGVLVEEHGEAVKPVMEQQKKQEQGSRARQGEHGREYTAPDRAKTLSSTA